MKNEPAFPSNISNCLDNLAVGIYQGMTLRDYFAGQVICEVYSDPDVGVKYASEIIGIKPHEYIVLEHFPVYCAKESYRIADAMLAERSKGAEK